MSQTIQGKTTSGEVVEVHVDEAGNLYTTPASTSGGGLTDAELRASPVKIRQVATTPAQSSVSLTSSNTSVLASNASRIGATVRNEGAATAYIILGATASTTSYTVQLLTNDYYEVPYGYTGAIAGITSSGTAQLRVTELT
jgi:hypothetical protein